MQIAIFRWGCKLTYNWRAPSCKSWGTPVAAWFIMETAKKTCMIWRVRNTRGRTNHFPPSYQSLRRNYGLVIYIQHYTHIYGTLQGGRTNYKNALEYLDIHVSGDRFPPRTGTIQVVQTIALACRFKTTKKKNIIQKQELFERVGFRFRFSVTASKWSWSEHPKFSSMQSMQMEVS